MASLVKNTLTKTLLTQINELRPANCKNMEVMLMPPLSQEKYSMFQLAFSITVPGYSCKDKPLFNLALNVHKSLIEPPASLDEVSVYIVNETSLTEP